MKQIQLNWLKSY